MIDTISENLEIADFAFESHPELEKNWKKWMILSLLDKYKNNIIFDKDKNGIYGLAVFFRLSDDMLMKVINGEIKIKPFRAILPLFKETGDNILVIGLVARDFKSIRVGFRRLIEQENPNIIAWLEERKHIKKWCIHQGRKNG